MTQMLRNADFFFISACHIFEKQIAFIKFSFYLQFLIRFEKIKIKVIKSLEINDFLAKMNENILLIDARSESEFFQGNIPRSINIPLLNNENRIVIGTLYKQKGREAAVKKGFELIGSQFYEKFDQIAQLANNKKVMIYCWRGGMRSGILSWMMSLANYEVFTLKGGYKSFRKKVLETNSKNYSFIILGGKTGCGKTECLQLLKAKNQQIIDLEFLANHKGSAFGQNGNKIQPSNENFENLIAFELLKCQTNQVIWIENESRLIGKLKIPDKIFDQLKNNLLLEIQIDEAERIQRIIKEYGIIKQEELIYCTQKIEKKLGNQRMRQAIEALQNNDYKTWVTFILHYYDQTYAYGLEKRNGKSISISFDWNDIEKSINTLLKNATLYEH